MVYEDLPVVDPGFLDGEGAPTDYLVNPFPLQMHSNEEILVEGCASLRPLDPPMRT